MPLKIIKLKIMGMKKMYRTIHYGGLTMKGLKKRIEEIEENKEAILEFKIIVWEKGD